MKPQLPFAFDYQEFIDDILNEIGLGNASEEVKMKMRYELFMKVSDRIMTVIMVELGDQHVEELKKIKATNPSYDEFEMMMAILPQIEGVEEKLQDHLAELRTDIIDDVKRLDEAMKK